MNILLLVLDGLSPRHVRPDIMPTLSRMAGEGGWNRAGGIAVMPASTYPNHATFVTGVSPAEHGLWSSRIPAPDPTAQTTPTAPLVEAWEVGPSSPTLFEVCARSGRSTAAVLGDHHLVGAMGTAAADTTWPPTGHFGPEVARDELDYADDGATALQIAAAVAEKPDLVVAQLNGPDTAAHLYGPDSEEAFAAYRYNDSAIATVRDALGSRWRNWVVLVVSDHSQEAADGDAIDLEAVLTSRGIPARVIRDGSAALVVGEGGRDRRWLDDVDDVVGTETLNDDTVVVWGRPGSSFGAHPWGIPGIHGSPRTAPQVAVVSGGHEATAAVARLVEAAPPPATSWARLAARLLGVAGGDGIPDLADPGIPR